MALCVDFAVQSQNLRCSCHAVEQIPSAGRGRTAQFVPIRFVSRNKLHRDDKLLLALDARVLSEVLRRGVSLGKIMYGENYATLKVKTSALATDVRKLTDKIGTLLASPSPPDLVLNRHCAEREFQNRCRQKAIEKDDLSLLSGMTEKERTNFNSKGIFTVTQLSHTFRPRRRPQGVRDKRERYHHSLKALAIREKKIHIVGSPEIKIEGTPVYIDVEGLPDRDFYYLIGVRVKAGDSALLKVIFTSLDKSCFTGDNMGDDKLILKYDIYIAAPVNKVWQALTDCSVTKQYFYGCSVRSTCKKGAPISYLGDGEFNMLDGEVLEVKPEKRLVTTFQALWADNVGKDKPWRVVFWDLAPIGEATKITLVHDQFAGETAAYKQSADGWNVILSSPKDLPGNRETPHSQPSSLSARVKYTQARFCGQVGLGSR